MKIKKSALYAGAALGMMIGVPLAMITPGHAAKKDKAPFWGRNFAHRGLHSPDRTIPENSLEAFRRAAEAGYGIELDVQLSKDGCVVVFHDDTLSRVCGVNARVDELTYAELSRLRLCGSLQTIPLLSEVLETVNGRVPLIVELKSGKNNRELCRKVSALLRDYTGSACVESFNPLIVAWFRVHAPTVLRGQLSTAQHMYRRSGYGPLKAFALSHDLFNFLSRPQFLACDIGKRHLGIRIAEAMGAMRVGWTAHDPTAEEGRDAVIFEFYRPRPRFKGIQK